jgi:hypothetical protein
MRRCGTPISLASQYWVAQRLEEFFQQDFAWDSERDLTFCHDGFW